MEGQLWKAILMVLDQVDKRRKRTDEDSSDEEIVKVFSWAVIHDRPISWACQPQNWPLHARRQVLPSDETMSRRAAMVPDARWDIELKARADYVRSRCSKIRSPASVGSSYEIARPSNDPSLLKWSAEVAA